MNFLRFLLLVFLLNSSYSKDLLQYDVDYPIDNTISWFSRPKLLKPRGPKISPIILVPGDGGSQLEAKLDKPSVIHYFCEQKTNKYGTLWLALTDLIPGVVDCWVDNMRLVYNTTTRKTENSPGVDIRVPGFGDTSTIEFIDPVHLSLTGYFNILVDSLAKLGFTRGLSIRGAPYDFRQSPTELDEFFKNLKTLVEETYSQNGNEKVILLCHSLGCLTTLYFINNNPQEWRDKHLKSYITLAAPWGGAIKSVKGFTSGDNIGVVIIPSLKIRKDERTFPSLALLLPSDEYWPKDEVFLSVGGENFTTGNYDKFFEKINYTVGYEMHKDALGLIPHFKAPQLETHCLHGIDVSTMEELNYDVKFFPDEQPDIKYGDGDGTVNKRSLEGCLKFTKQQKQQVFYETFSKADHMSILADARVIDYIVKVATE